MVDGHKGRLERPPPYTMIELSRNGSRSEANTALSQLDYRDLTMDAKS